MYSLDAAGRFSYQDTSSHYLMYQAEKAYIFC